MVVISLSLHLYMAHSVQQFNSEALTLKNSHCGSPEVAKTVKMAGEATYSKAFKISSLCLAWYAVSSINNVVTKLILNEFPYPMTVTMVHLVSTSLYSVPVLLIWDIPSSARIPLRLWFKLIIPLALGKVFSSVSSHISIWKVPVSYAHTGKYPVIMSYFYLTASQTPNSPNLWPVSALKHKGL